MLFLVVVKTYLMQLCLGSTLLVLEFYGPFSYFSFTHNHLKK